MIKEAAELLEAEGGTLSDSYSGRGMYGETTYSVSFDSTSELTAACIRAAYELGRNGGDDVNVEDVLSAFDNLRTDSTGFCGIVVY